MHALTRPLALGSAAALLAVLSACGLDDEETSDGKAPTVTITSPADGDSVATDFPVTWTSNVELGEPDTGRDHVHVFVDGHENDYTVVGDDEFMIECLSPGEHTVNVTLQHADHSSAGAEDEIDINVDPSAPIDESTPTPDDTDTPNPGPYDY